jgi:hypothetical protein
LIPKNLRNRQNRRIKGVANMTEITPYKEAFPVGAAVRVADRAYLEEFIEGVEVLAGFGLAECPTPHGFSRG